MGVGQGKGQLHLRPVGTLVVRERMGKATAVQSGRALPMGRLSCMDGGGSYTFRLTHAAKHAVNYTVTADLIAFYVPPYGLGSLYIVNHCNRKKGPAQKMLLCKRL